jgi:hypothetical protein
MIIIFLLEVIGYLYLFFQFLLQKTKKKQKKNEEEEAEKKMIALQKTAYFESFLGIKTTQIVLSHFFRFS